MPHISSKSSYFPFFAKFLADLMIFQRFSTWPSLKKSSNLIQICQNLAKKWRKAMVNSTLKSYFPIVFSRPVFQIPDPSLIITFSLCIGSEFGRKSKHFIKRTFGSNGNPFFCSIHTLKKNINSNYYFFRENEKLKKKSIPMITPSLWVTKDKQLPWNSSGTLTSTNIIGSKIIQWASS